MDRQQIQVLDHVADGHSHPALKLVKRMLVDFLPEWSDWNVRQEIGTAAPLTFSIGDLLRQGNTGPIF
jgi:hypothetical protein